MRSGCVASARPRADGKLVEVAQEGLLLGAHDLELRARGLERVRLHVQAPASAPGWDRALKAVEFVVYSGVS